MEERRSKTEELNRQFEEDMPLVRAQVEIR